MLSLRTSVRLKFWLISYAQHWCAPRPSSWMCQLAATSQSGQWRRMTTIIVMIVQVWVGFAMEAYPVAWCDQVPACTTPDLHCEVPWQKSSSQVQSLQCWRQQRVAKISTNLAWVCICNKLYDCHHTIVGSPLDKHIPAQDHSAKCHYSPICAKLMLVIACNGEDTASNETILLHHKPPSRYKWDRILMKIRALGSLRAKPTAGMLKVLPISSIPCVCPNTVAAVIQTRYTSIYTSHHMYDRSIPQLLQSSIDHCLGNKPMPMGLSNMYWLSVAYLEGIKSWIHWCWLQIRSQYRVSKNIGAQDEGVHASIYKVAAAEQQKNVVIKLAFHI